MNTQLDRLVTASAPQIVLRVLVALFIIGAIVCLVLAVAAGHCGDVARWLGKKVRQGLRKLSRRRRWLFIPRDSTATSLNPGSR